VSPKRGDRVAPPPGPDDWDVRFANNESAKGWEELGNQAAGNTRWAWHEMCTAPAPRPPTQRHHPLRDQVAYVAQGSRKLRQWQIEVTGGGRVWYAPDAERRIVWVTYASPRHPKVTD